MRPKIGETWKWSSGESNTHDLNDYIVFVSDKYAYILTLELFSAKIEKIKLSSYINDWIKCGYYKKI